MANSTEPKKETVRIMLPQPNAQTTGAASKPRETVRINLPTRGPANASAPRPPTSTTEPAAITGGPATPMSAPSPAAPKKETARISVLPDPPSRPAVQMKKTQPLIDVPAAERPASPVTVAPETRTVAAEIPRPLCWALLGVSAAILIIQIWNYLS